MYKTINEKLSSSDNNHNQTDSSTPTATSTSAPEIHPLVVNSFIPRPGVSAIFSPSSGDRKLYYALNNANQTKEITDKEKQSSSDDHNQTYSSATSTPAPKIHPSCEFFYS
jgi:hypothetical protein